MYSLSRQIHPPTVIEHSIYCNFYNDNERNLITGGGNQIKIYRLISTKTTTTKLTDEEQQLINSTDENQNNNNQDELNKVKLEYLQSFSFFGQLSSLNHIRLNKSNRDSILLTFMDAKLSIVEYDPLTHNLKTLSMNYFEDDEFKQGYINNSIHQPIVRSDPDNRCCAMFNYGRNVIIIPFKSETTDEHAEQQIQGLQEIKQTNRIGSYNFTNPSFKNTILPAYKLDLQDKNFSGEKINNIIDLQFLEGYYEPTLLILYEPIRTWAGRIAVRQDTCAMIALSLNVHQKVHPIIWSTNNLPFDSQYVLPVPRPISGVLIFCTNILIYLNQSVPSFAVSLNSFAETSTAFTLQPQRNLKISLDCSKACFLSNDKLLISLKGGEIYLVTLFIDRMRSVKRFHFEKAASTVISSCLTYCGKEHLFLGSRLGNSLLLKYTERIINNSPKLFDDKTANKDNNKLVNGLNDDDQNKEEDNNQLNGDNLMETSETKINNNENEIDEEDEFINENITTEATTTTTTDNELKETNENMTYSSFVNDNLEENDFYGENEFIFKEKPIENYKKRKFDEIEFDDEDKDLYGEDDPIFQDEDEEEEEENKINNQQQLNNKNDQQLKQQQLNNEDDNSNKEEEEDKSQENDKENDEQKLNQQEQQQQQNDENNEEENLKNLLNDDTGIDNDLYNETPATTNIFINEEEENENNELIKKSTEQENNQQQQKEEEEQQQQQKQEIEEPQQLTEQQIKDNLDALGDWMAGDVALLKDNKELELFGTDEIDDKLPVTLTFEVLDSIINIGPCSRFCMGELSFLAEELEKDNEHQIEIVTTSGCGKNGALCVLQRTIRPQIVTTFSLPKCLDMWTVYSLQKDVDFKENATNDPKHHAYLILSRLESTMILQTGQEINELDKNGFICDSRTIFAGNLYNNKYIIQVSPNTIRLIEGTKQIMNFPLDLGSPIVSSSLEDPHCIVMTENGTLVHLNLSYEQESVPKLKLVKLDFPSWKSQITSCCLYGDISGLFITKFKDLNDSTSELINNRNRNKSKTELIFSNKDNVEIDDLDELLYGDSDVNAIVGASIKNTNKKHGLSSSDDKYSEEDIDQQSNVKRIGSEEKTPTYWLFLTREDGSLEIYSIPDIILVYQINDFALAPQTLLDTSTSSNNNNNNQNNNQNNNNSSSILEIDEIFIGGFGVKQTRPLLFVRFREEICVYEIFQFLSTELDNHLKIRFTKLNNTLILNESSSNHHHSLVKYRKYLRSFHNISGYSGLFVCGSLPHWFFMSELGELRCHEMSIDGYVPSFCTFNNINCPKGFLYFNDREELRIAVLPTHITYDSPWPVRKVPIKSTVHFIKYHVKNKCYVVVTSVSEEYRKLVKLGGDDKDFELLERDDRYIYPTTEKFSIQLFSPVSWEIINGTRIDLDEWEHVTCLQNVMLQTEGTETGFKGFVALGTNYCFGEDVTNKGRIMILDIVEVVPEPGQPLTKNKIKIAYSKEQKGPVTALTQVRGYLLSSIGQKIYIWQLKEDQLAGVAFIDTQIYIHSAVSIKNLILVADYYKSISLLRYQEETKTLALVSKDIRSFEVYACEFMVDNNLLCFIVSDADKNIILYHYQPEIRESNGGARLIQRADYHIGSRINHFFRIRCKKSKHLTDEQNRENLNRQLTMFATLDGSLGYILPISEKIYRRLLMVQNLMNNQLPNLAGLNPKAFRLYKSSSRVLLNPCKNILDGDLLSKYINLSSKQKEELARKIGTTTKQIRNDLFQIDLITSHF